MSQAPGGRVAALRRRLGPWLGPLVALALFTLALLVLRRELHAVSYRQLTRTLFDLPRGRLLLGLLLVAVNYLVLTGYDLLALRYVGRAVAAARVMLASFVAFAIQYNVGFGMVSGASVRYRFFSRWGIGAADLSRVVVFYTVTFWLGLLLLGGLALVLDPLSTLHQLPGHEWARAAGLGLLAVCLAYAVAAGLRRRPLRLGRYELRAPGPRIVALQFVLSTVDWTLAAATVWVLLPAGRPSLALFLGAYLLATLVAMVSHVPGGLGVFESLMVLLLKPALAAGLVLPALLAFRALYYLLPLAVALLVLVGDEVRQRRAEAARVNALFGALAGELTPRALALFTFAAGGVLLLSGATPAELGRLRWLDGFLPLGVLEVSHFINSLVGVGLLLLSQGIARRLDVSYYLTVGALGLGIVVSLLKGADFEEALVLGFVLFALWRSRAEFDRKGAFFATRFSPGWVTAVVAAVGAAVWLGFFSFKHVDYSNDLWWTFELRGDASRFLRASVGAAVALLAFGVGRLLRPTPPVFTPASEEQRSSADAVIATQEATYPFLVHLGDKAVLFDEERRAFLMYGVQGRTWVALGDPVGPVDRGTPLVRAFLERVDDYCGTPVFYQVARERLHLYADFGLAFLKMGEEALVDLSGFSLDGARGKGHRQVLRRLEKEGGSFRVAPADEVPCLLAELRGVSDDWLAQKDAGEKGFSLGFFDESYLRRFPVAVVTVDGRVQAFANLLPGPGRQEVSLDLMRFRESAPQGVMQALFVHLLVWARDEGYSRFNLGMAPLSGIEGSPLAPLWNRMASFLYEHGEPLYGFQGLRQFKEKFHPRWEPRYLAYPGGLRLPRILADVSALVAGGYVRIFRK
jgi:phosphatidylglycerol lysyltransferase